jgi:thiamine-monophosphate kinase
VAERELIAAIARLLPEPGPDLIVGTGDDAAVARAGPVTVTSVDTVVEGVHFDLAWCSPADAGARAIAAALSDIAAMGARPAQAYVALVVPGSFGLARAEQVVRGLVEAAGAVDIAGGDVVAGPALAISVTAVGSCGDASRLVYRSGAGPGERVGVTGRLGAAVAGLALAGGADAHVDEGARAELLTRLRRPRARIDAGAALAAAGVSAMIDLSDGLAADCLHLAERSDVAISIVLDRLPLADGVADVAAALGRPATELAASGGDDYELLFTAPESRAGAVAAAADVSWIGSTAAGPAGLSLLGPDAEPVTLRGFEHAL